MIQSLLSLVALSVTLLGNPPSNEPVSTVDYYNQYDWEKITHVEAFNAPIDLENPDYDKLEIAIFMATNKERELHHLSPLTYCSNLKMSSQDHSKDMLAKNYFEHNTPQGQYFADRIVKYKSDCSIVGENIAKLCVLAIAPGEPYYYKKINGKYQYTSNGNLVKPETYNGYAEKVVKAWMASPGHRENILSKSYKTMGCGVLLPTDPLKNAEMPRALITQDFAG